MKVWCFFSCHFIKWGIQRRILLQSGQLEKWGNKRLCEQKTYEERSSNKFEIKVHNFGLPSIHTMTSVLYKKPFVANPKLLLRWFKWWITQVMSVLKGIYFCRKYVTGRLTQNADLKKKCIKMASNNFQNQTLYIFTLFF